MDERVTETVVDWHDGCWRKDPKVQTSNERIFSVLIIWRSW